MWLPVGDNYKTVNVDAQEKAENSHLKIFRRLTKIRKEPVFREGTYFGVLTNDENVYAYLRQHNNDYAVVLLNFGTTTANVDVKRVLPSVPSTMKVYTSSLESGLANG
jgi:alpha-glucosidase